MKNCLNVLNFKRMSAIGLLASMSITYPAWICGGILTPIPVFSWLSFHESVQGISLVAIVVWVIYIAVYPKGTRQGVVAMALICLAVIMDLNKCQIWLLHFIYIFLLPAKLNEEEVKISILFMISVTYIFSGIQKFNIGFAQETLPWLIKPFGFSLNHHLHQVIPAFEILLGIFLCIPRISPLSSACCVFLHAGIIYILIYYRWNLSVVPWNTMLVIYHFIIAVNGGIKFRPAVIRSLPLMGCFLIIPTLSYFGFIHRSFSFQLYTGNQYTGIVIFSDEAFGRLPQKVKMMCEKLKKTQEPFLNLDRYAMLEIGVPLFQDMKCYKSAARSFIPYTRNDNDLVLLVRNGPEFIFEKDLWAFTLAELSEQPVGR